MKNHQSYEGNQMCHRVEARWPMKANDSPLKQFIQKIENFSKQTLFSVRFQKTIACGRRKQKLQRAQGHEESGPVHFSNLIFHCSPSCHYGLSVLKCAILFPNTSHCTCCSFYPEYSFLPSLMNPTLANIQLKYYLLRPERGLAWQLYLNTD